MAPVILVCFPRIVKTLLGTDLHDPQSCEFWHQNAKFANFWIAHSFGRRASFGSILWCPHIAKVQIACTLVTKVDLETLCLSVIDLDLPELTLAAFLTIITYAPILTSISIYIILDNGQHLRDNFCIIVIVISSASFVMDRILIAFSIFGYLDGFFIAYTATLEHHRRHRC
ncbi:hypothetical protein VTP01DRAFT_6905 [Rhizomucor pusillus]|uniref:uncharacterized protein n=1 Tax=Rhizomucor pusillus TaxID=4840 RepID=UPI0037433545